MATSGEYDRMGTARYDNLLMSYFFMIIEYYCVSYTFRSSINSCRVLGKLFSYAVLVVSSNFPDKK